MNKYYDILTKIDDDKEIDVCCDCEDRAKELQKNLTVDSQVIPVEVLLKELGQVKTRFAIIVDKEKEDASD